MSSSEAEIAEAAGAKPKPGLAKRTVPWLITAACFAFLYTRIAGPAHAEGLTVPEYLGRVFAQVNWVAWLGLMIPYSMFFFLVDSTIVWRVINWFNARVAYTDILPVRASTYVLSILNEQLGKGAMAVYLNRREGVPGWKLGSSMLFIMFCEFYYLLGWATLGAALQWEDIPEIFHWLPLIAAGAVGFFIVHYLYFRGVLAPGAALRERHILDAFRQARLGQYLGVLALRSPALLAAAFVYSQALSLFGVEIGYVAMLGYLPVIFFGAAVPGPFRAVAISMWVILFPGHPAEMSAFGLVQHNFFIFFNAAIGLVFMRRANREIFGTASPEPPASPGRV